MYENNKEFWTAFINLYRERPVLWDQKCKKYCNKNARAAAYADLVQLSRSIYPKADTNFVIRKITSLRASFRRQLRKLSPDPATKADGDVPEPTLWYFDLMRFTIDQDELNPGGNAKVRKRSKTIDEYSSGCQFPPTINEQSKKIIQLDETSNSSENSSLESSSQPNTSPRPGPSRKKKSVEHILWNAKRNRLADSVIDYFKHGNNTPPNDCTMFGKSMGLELELVTDIVQRDIAKKLISDVLFLAKAGKLFCDSRIQASWFNTMNTPLNPSHQNLPNC